MNFKNMILATAATIFLPFAVSAAVVANAGTSVGGNFLAQGFTAVDVFDPNGNWNESLTTPESHWLWDAQNGDGQAQGGDPDGTLVWTYSFDLTGYDMTTAAVTGFAAMDNFGTVDLNGSTILTLTGNTPSNYAWLSNYGTPEPTLFNVGLNTLTYTVTNNQGPGGFRATVNVQADVAPVPLPAGAFLLLGGLGGLAAMRRRKKVA